MLLDRIRPAVVALATQVADDRMKALAVEGAGWVERALRREAHLSRAVTSTAPLPVQAGLFDNRALASKHDLERQHRSIMAQSAGRSALLEAGASVFLAQEPCITLMLVAC